MKLTFPFTYSEYNQLFGVRFRPIQLAGNETGATCNNQCLLFLNSNNMKIRVKIVSLLSLFI